MDVNENDKYEGATINILVGCDPQTFLNKYNEYAVEPFVVTKFLGRRFREEVADGQMISCNSSPLLPSKSVKAPGPGTGPGPGPGSGTFTETGTVGYWIAEKDKTDTLLGTTVFHILDVSTTRRCPRKFSSHKSNCLNFVKNTGSYDLYEEHGEYTCTYVAGLYDKLLDVGVVRCTKQRRENQPDSEADKESFQWPRLLYKIVVEMERDLRTVLLDYETKHLKGRNLSIFHNGKNSIDDIKVGVLTDEFSLATFRSAKLKTSDDDDLIAVEPAAKVKEVPLNLELLEGMYNKYFKDHVKGSESLRGSSVDACDRSYAESSNEVFNGVDESPASVAEKDLYLCDGIDKDLAKDSSPNEESTTLPEGDTVNGAASARGAHSNVEDTTGVQEDDYIELTSSDSDESDSDVEGDATQCFTHGGDSGCVYYLLIEKDGQPLKAPIAIHRGSSKDRNNGKRISYGSPIEMAVKKLKELHEVDVWFPIVD